MRWLRLVPLLSAVFLSSCSAWDRSAGASHYRTPLTFATPDPEHPLANLDADHPITPDARAPSPPPPSAPSQAIRATRVHRLSSKGVSLTLLAFDDRNLTISVADKRGGPDTQWQSARSAAGAHGAIAAINAGFFTPEGSPLGLVIEDGTRFGSWNTVSSLVSGVLVVQDTGPRLLRRNRWSRAASARHLVQAGPLLLENGQAVSGLSSRAQRARSFLAWDGRHHWIMGHTPSATLASLATALAAQPLSGSRFSTALNLDGGRSADLWVSSSIRGTPVSTRRFWNKPVRNYVLVTKRTR